MGTLQDYRLALRTLKERPTYAMLGSTILALTIGANSAVFRVIDALWLRLPPVAAPESLGLVVKQQTGAVGGSAEVFPAGFARGRITGSGVHAAAIEVTAGGLTGDFRPHVTWTDGSPLEAVAVSHDYFSVLGVAVRGRGFLAAEDVPGTHPAVVISDTLWRSRFGSEPLIVGRSVELSGIAATVAGIAPPDFRGPFRGDHVDLWLPIGALASFAPRTGPLLDLAPVRVFVRLDSVAARQVAETALSSSFGGAMQVRTLQDSPYSPTTGSGAARDAQLLAVAWTLSLVVFAIGCLGFAGLVTTRAEERQREVYVRLALGVSRPRLTHLLMAEPVVLAVAGGAGATLVSRAGIALVADFALASGVQIGALDVSADWRVAASIALATLVALLAAGLGSFFAVSLSSRIVFQAPQKLGQRKDFFRRHALLVPHVAVSMVLLVLAALLVRSVQRALNANTGYAAEHLVAVLVQPRLAQYLGDRDELDLMRRGQDYVQLLERIRSLAGVTAATSGTPPLTDWAGPISNVRLQLGTVSVETAAQYRRVGAAYLTVVGIPLLAGRDFDTTDFLPGAEPVVILSGSVAERLGDMNLVGRSITLTDGREAQVVGIAEETNGAGVQKERPSAVYVPERTADQGMVAIVVRTTSEAGGVTHDIQAVAQQLFPGAVQLHVRTHTDDVRREMANERLGAIAFSWFGATSAVLSLASVYASVAYRTRSRHREWGIRIALGAAPKELLRRIVLVHGMAPVAAGVLLGSVGCVLAGGLVKAHLFGIGPTDILAFGVPAISLVVGGIVAAYLASHHLLQMNPRRLFLDD